MNDDLLGGNVDAVAIASAVAAGTVHAREVVAAAIDRVQAANSNLGFLVADRYEEALIEAECVDPHLPLAGVPVLLKDFLATCSGLVHTEGSLYLRNWTPVNDSGYVARLRRAGAVILGATSTPEFALLSACEPRRYGITRNPRAPERTTGGSSGGSAAAVSAGAVPAAHGNDAGGSIRIPASCCGVVGLKPTRGRNSLGPAHGDLSAGLWTEHVLTRSVRDSATFLDVTHGFVPGDPYAAPAPAADFVDAPRASPRRLRIATGTHTPWGDDSAPCCAAAVERTAAALASVGHEVTEAAPDFGFPEAERDFFDLFCAGAAARVQDWERILDRPPRTEELEPYTWGILARASELSATQLLSCISRLQRTARQIADFFEHFDIWLTPTLPQVPPPLGFLQIAADESVDDVLTRDAKFTPFVWLANVTGQPALSFPAATTPDGVPIGVQLMARFGEELTLFSVAARLELLLGADSFLR